MPPSVPQGAGGQPPSSTDLPYGPLPARSDQSCAPDESRSPLVDPLLGLEAELPPRATAAEMDAGGDPPQDEYEEPDDRVQLPDASDPSADQLSIGERLPERSSQLEVSSGRAETDDDVHFGVAAKALGVSRKTVERMVKRGALERGPSGSPATVSKRGLVGLLEERRRDVGQLTRATPQHRPPGNESVTAYWPQDAIAELQELLRPVLEPLLDEFVDARARAATLESQLQSIEARAAQERARDELLLALATGGWRQRRKARRAAIRHYVLREDVSGSNSS